MDGKECESAPKSRRHMQVRKQKIRGKINTVRVRKRKIRNQSTSNLH